MSIDKPLSRRVHSPQELRGEDGPGFVDVRIIWLPWVVGYARPILDSEYATDAAWAPVASALETVFTNPPFNEADKLRPIIEGNRALYAWLLETARNGLATAVIDDRPPVELPVV
jgi:hypothetical protein